MKKKTMTKKDRTQIRVMNKKATLWPYISRVIFLGEQKSCHFIVELEFHDEHYIHNGKPKTQIAKIMISERGFQESPALKFHKGERGVTKTVAFDFTHKILSVTLSKEGDFATIEMTAQKPGGK